MFTQNQIGVVCGELDLLGFKKEATLLYAAHLKGDVNEQRKIIATLPEGQREFIASVQRNDLVTIQK